MADKVNYRCIKLSNGKYEYRGFVVHRVGYHESDKRVVWEGYNPKDGRADYHGYSKQMVKKLIDNDILKKEATNG